MPTASWPKGTPEELVAAGVDIEKARSCGPSGTLHGEDGVPYRQMGCQFWKQTDPNTRQESRCFFNKPNMALDGTVISKICGAGPKNIAYWHELDVTETHEGDSRPPTFINFIPCYLFMQNMKGRMDHMAENGERIHVVGVEGDGKKFPQKVVVLKDNPQNPTGPKVKVVEIEDLEVPKHDRLSADNLRNRSIKAIAEVQEQGQEDALKAYAQMLTEQSGKKDSQ